MTNGNPPLTGLRVVELTQALAGPFTATTLGDLGADVIKVEPLYGDQARGYTPPEINGESAYFFGYNRNKRSLTLNYAKAQGREILSKLIAEADIFLTNNRSIDSMHKYGYDYDTLQTTNPGLIVAAISGYGHSGPNAGLPGYDVIAQGTAGTMSMTGEPNGEPLRFPTPMADITTALYTVIGILAALNERSRSGKGQFIDVALVDSQATWLGNLAASYFATGQTPQRMGNDHPQIVPYQPFKARDKHFIVGVGSERLWQRFCDILKLDQLRDDPRFHNNEMRTKNRDEFNRLVEPLFLERDAGEWVTLFRKEGLPCGPINSVPDLLNDEHFLARGGVVEIEHETVGTVKSIGNPIHLLQNPVSYRLPPPMLGEHNKQILSELGYTPEQINELSNEGVI